MIYHNPKLATVLAGLLFLLATTAMAAALPLDSLNSDVITEASPCLAGSWIEKANTIKAGALGEAVVGTGDYIYISWCRYNTTQPEFWRYDPSENKWNYSMSTSGLPRGAFRTGTALAWDHENHIYAMLGARYKEDTDRHLFYRYNISNDTWEQSLNNTPYSQGAGDAITWCNYDNKSYIYAIMGKSYDHIHYGYFARYDPLNDTWENLNFTWTCTDDGASLVWTGGKYLYALQGEVDEKNGNKNNNFSRYDIDNDKWEDMANISEDGCGVGDGGSLLWIGNWIEECANYIYALGGGCANESGGYNFYAYNVSNNSWKNLKPIPCPIGYYVGNRLGFANGHIYYWQGAPTTEKWICGGDAFFMFDIGTTQSGSISVSSTPSGAGLSFDGIPINAITPYTITDVEPGYHTIKLTLEGYSDWSKSVNVKAGETSYVSASLTEIPTIVINEVELNPPGNDNSKSVIEWIELYNPASKDVDLTGWTLKTTHGRIGKVYPSGTIEANGYRFFGKDSQWLDNEDDDSVILRDANGIEIDRTPQLNDEYDDDRTWQRCPNGKDTDSDSDWKFRPSTKGYSNGE